MKSSFGDEMESITLAASVSELLTINKFIDEQLQVSKKLKYDIQLIAEEMLTNVSKYAYKDTPDSSRFVKFAAGHVFFDGIKSIFMQFTYGGPPFDPFTQAPSPDIKQDISRREAGGLGLYLIKKISTHYTYARIDGRNQVHVYLKNM